MAKKPYASPDRSFEETQAPFQGQDSGVPSDLARHVAQSIRDAQQARQSGMAEGDATEKLDPRVSEFETEGEADQYETWFRGKVEKSLADKRPGVPHDRVMAELDAIIENAEQRQKRR